MTDKRKIEICDEILGFASEMWNGYELYEWARNRGMSHKEIEEEFYFNDDNELKEYQKKYLEEYK